MSSPDPNLIGRGGGFGRYHGLTLHEIEERFAACLSDPSMRSVTAVLRITREQIDARGQLSIYPRLALGFALASPVLFAIQSRLPKELQSKAMPAAIGLGALSLILFYGSVTTHKERQASVAQVKRIQDLAAETLETLLKVEFAWKPLTREHLDTLRDLIKWHPEKECLKVLLAHCQP